MATQVLKTQIQTKRGTAEAWERLNPILAAGEPGWAIDTKDLRVGDGITPWNDLNSLSSTVMIYFDTENKVSSHTAHELNSYLADGKVVVAKDEHNNLYYLADKTDETVCFISLRTDFGEGFGYKIIEDRAICPIKLSISQSDWIETNDKANSFIQNKPAISSGFGVGSIQEGEGLAVGNYSHAEGDSVYITATLIEPDETRTIWHVDDDVWFHGCTSLVSDGGFYTIINTDSDTITLNKSIPGEETVLVCQLHQETGAFGAYSHIEGYDTYAEGEASHAEGWYSHAYGHGSHAEGGGFGTEAYGNGSHAEGTGTSARGNSSHTEGVATYAIGEASHAEGYRSRAEGNYSHAEGFDSAAEGNYSHAEGGATHAIGENSHAEGEETYAFGHGAHAEGFYLFAPINWRLSTTDPERKVWTYGSLGTATIGDFVEYDNSFFAIKEIHQTNKTITFSVSVPGTSTTNVAFHYYGKIGAYGDYSHAEGEYTRAIGVATHAEGYKTEAGPNYSHAEGQNTKASGQASHAEGDNTMASGFIGTHAEGGYTVAEGDYSHAEGKMTHADGFASHSEGNWTTASGSCSHTEGEFAMASGDNSHAEGQETTALGKCQHVQGIYNVSDDTVTTSNPFGTFAHIVGNSFSSAPSNAHALDWEGNAYFKGNVYVNGTQPNATGGEKVATESYVDGLVYLGISNGWYVRKWRNGVVECWRTISKTIESTDWTKGKGGSFGFTVLGQTIGIESSALTKDIQLPFPSSEIFTFIERPTEIVTISNDTSWRPLTLMGRNKKEVVTLSTTKLYNIITNEPENETNGLDVTLDFYVVGRWK